MLLCGCAPPASDSVAAFIAVLAVGPYRASPEGADAGKLLAAAEEFAVALADTG